MTLQPAPSPVDVSGTNIVSNVMRHLMPQCREIGADLDKPVGVSAVDPNCSVEEVLVSPLAAAIVSDQYLGPWRTIRIVPQGVPTCDDLLPRGVEVITPRCGGLGGRCAANQSRECQCNDSSHVNNDSHLAI